MTGIRFFTSGMGTVYKGIFISIPYLFQMRFPEILIKNNDLSGGAQAECSRSACGTYMVSAAVQNLRRALYDFAAGERT